MATDDEQNGAESPELTAALMMPGTQLIEWSARRADKALRRATSADTRSAGIHEEITKVMAQMRNVREDLGDLNKELREHRVAIGVALAESKDAQAKASASHPPPGRKVPAAVMHALDLFDVVRDRLRRR